MTRFTVPLARQLAALVCGLGFCATAAASILPLTNIARIAGGYGHSCALTDSGGVLCWGGNSSGQLGNGTNIDSFVAVNVKNLNVTVQAIAAGTDHTCVLTVTGGVKCWGDNLDGQLGIGSKVDSAVPVDVPGLTSDVIAIDAAGYNTCALTAGGGVKCWGYNNTGQVGNGTKVTALSPTDVVGLASGMVAIATGAHSCALAANGSAKCWGWNSNGQLGNGSFADSTVPVDVATSPVRMVRIAVGGGNTCALGDEGSVWCWGKLDGTGMPGNADRTVPTVIETLTDGATDLDMGNGHACVIKLGRPMCWGNNSYGQAGDGTLLHATYPTNLFHLYGATSVATGNVHTCAVIHGGAKCWGDAGGGKLGNGLSTYAVRPVDVVGLGSPLSAIVAGNMQTCGLTPTGAVKCWGGTHFGINPTFPDGDPGAGGESPNIPELSSGVTALALGDVHACALLATGGVRCWGGNLYGQLGVGYTSGPIYTATAPLDVVGLSSGARAITAGIGHSCALMQTGGVKCWGSGALGTVPSSSPVPVDVVGLPQDVIAIASGATHSCALSAAGAVRCWGANFHGEIGNGTKVAAPTPVDVVGLDSGVVAISAGNSTTCALLNDGAVKCWGSNFGGSLGIGTLDDATVPTAVVGLSGVRAISGSGGHQCALQTGVTGAQCWGQNALGALGSGDSEKAVAPQPVVDLPMMVDAISAGRLHTCALIGGNAKCWGQNYSGELGNGGARFYLHPTEVLTGEPGSSSVDGSLAIEYYHPGLDHYFITANPLEVAGLDAQVYPTVLGGQWERTGQSFRVQPAPSPGWAPVCRFFSTFGVKSSHFYTADAVECAGLSSVWPNWLFENIAFHMALPDADGACPPGTIYVYRLYNKGLGGAPSHRLTTSFSLRETMIAQRGWISEGSGHNGVAMCAPI